MNILFKSATTLLLGLLAAGLVGCRTGRMSPREAFLSRAPDRTNYYKLYEVSIESLRAEEDRILRLTKGFTKGVRSVTTNCPPCAPLQEHLSRVDMIADKLHKPDVAFIERLQKDYDPKTDTILFFHYWDSSQDEVGFQDYGYLVTRGGVVKKKFAFGEEQHD